MNLGKQIKEKRESAKITQAELAEKLLLSVHAISKYEQGQREPSMERIKKIAEALKVSTYELLTGSPEIDEIKAEDLINKHDIAYEKIWEFLVGKREKYDLSDSNTFITMGIADKHNPMMRVTKNEDGGETTRKLTIEEFKQRSCLMQLIQSHNLIWEGFSLQKLDEIEKPLVDYLKYLVDKTEKDSDN